MSPSAYYKDSTQDNQIRNRTALIYILEMILHQHRLKHATIFNPLEGPAALHHLIFMKTRWFPGDIRKLSFEDSLFVIQDEIKIENLTDEAQSALKILELPNFSVTFEHLPEKDWDYMENSIHLQNLKMKASQ
ncbi:ECs1072 family phage-associated protein [Superficieibacter electus]